MQTSGPELSSGPAIEPAAAAPLAAPAVEARNEAPLAASGNGIRVFTTLRMAGGDPMLLLQFGLGVTVNTEDFYDPDFLMRNIVSEELDSNRSSAPSGSPYNPKSACANLLP